MRARDGAIPTFDAPSPLYKPQPGRADYRKSRRNRRIRQLRSLRSILPLYRAALGTGKQILNQTVNVLLMLTLCDTSSLSLDAMLELTRGHFVALYGMSILPEANRHILRAVQALREVDSTSPVPTGGVWSC